MFIRTVCEMACCFFRCYLSLLWHFHSPLLTSVNFKNSQLSAKLSRSNQNYCHDSPVWVKWPFNYNTLLLSSVLDAVCCCCCFLSQVSLWKKVLFILGGTTWLNDGSMKGLTMSQTVCHKSVKEVIHEQWALGLGSDYLIETCLATTANFITWCQHTLSGS